jgi:hypothetical protein
MSSINIEAKQLPCHKCISMKNNILVGFFVTPLKLILSSDFLLGNLEVGIPLEWELQRESPIEANYINCKEIIQLKMKRMIL